MKKKIIIVWAAVCSLAFLLLGAAVVGYQDWQLRGSAPANPASGFYRIWADNAGQYFKCLTSSGSACYFDPAATSATPGIVRPDNSTITVSSGVISATGSSSGSLADIFSSGKTPGTIACETHKNLSIASGATATILATVSGAGYVSEINAWSNQYGVRIAVTVDGESTASIQGYLPDFLGDHYSDSQPAFSNRWITSSNAGGNNPGGAFRLPIPFGSTVNVTLTNMSGSTAVITSYIVYHTGVADTWTYTQRLHMTIVGASGITANTETNMVNVTPGKRWRLAGIGWIYDAYPGGANPAAAPLEGAFKIYVDGASTPNLTSSGSEDFFGMGWYFNLFNSFSSACCNATGTTSPSNPDVVLTMKTIYTWGAQRFFINDPIVGNNALRVSWTCGNTAAVNFSGTCTLYSSVWWYSEN